MIQGVRTLEPQLNPLRGFLSSWFQLYQGIREVEWWGPHEPVLQGPEVCHEGRPCLQTPHFNNSRLTLLYHPLNWQLTVWMPSEVQVWVLSPTVYSLSLLTLCYRFSSSAQYHSNLTFYSLIYTCTYLQQLYTDGTEPHTTLPISPSKPTK